MTREEIETCIRHPKFSHGRAGDRLYRGKTLLYHFADTPSGVQIAGCGDAEVVDAIIRDLRNTSPLSPTEAR